MSSTDAPDEENDQIEWTVNLQNVSFSTTIDADPGIKSSEVEAQATEELIEAIQSGDVKPRFSLSSKTPEDQEIHAAMDDALRCDRCEEITQEDQREIIVDDTIQVVCASCKDELKNVCNDCKRPRDEWDDDESREIVGHHNGAVVEFLCSTCANDDDDE